jgi:hypothetical protein
MLNCPQSVVRADHLLERARRAGDAEVGHLGAGLGNRHANMLANDRPVGQLISGNGPPTAAPVVVPTNWSQVLSSVNIHTNITQSNPTGRTSTQAATRTSPIKAVSAATTVTSRPIKPYAWRWVTNTCVRWTTTYPGDTIDALPVPA